MGDFHHDSGVSYPVCPSTSHLSDPHGFHAGGFTVYECATGRDLVPVWEGGHQGGASRQQPGGVLLPVLSGSKERWQTPPNSGPQGTQQVSPAFAMQNVDRPEGETICLQGGLVCHNRLKGFLLPNSHLGKALAVSQVRLKRQDIRVPSSPIWYIPGSSHLHKVHGSSAVTTQTEGGQSLKLFRRLAPVRTYRRRVSSSSVSAVGTPTTPRPTAQCRKKQTRAVSEDAVSGPNTGFSDCVADTDLRETALYRSMSLTLQTRGSSDMGSVSPPPGSHGISISGNPVSPLTYAPSPEISPGARAGAPESSASGGAGYKANCG